MIDTIAYARAGLLGNPSDGYFGKTISVIVKNFAAKILLHESPLLHIKSTESDSNRFKSIYELKDIVSSLGYNGGIPIIKATLKRFCDYCDTKGINLPPKNCTIYYSSNIPRQVGMAGSSAIVIATLRSLMKYYEVDIPIEILPSLALSVEVEELHINAGLQDRVIQSYEGCVYMNFDKQLMAEKGHGYYERLPVNNLPSLYIAYKTSLSKVSGVVLNNIKTRYDKGEELVVNTLQEIASLAEKGKEALLQQDYEELGKLINQNFDNRTKIMNISPQNMEMIQAARQCGASASFTGSGGAIIGIYKGNDMLQNLVNNLKKINARVINPDIN